MDEINAQIAALEAEAQITPTGLGQWAADILTEAKGLATGRSLVAISVECACIVYLGERSDDFAEKTWPVHASVLAMRSEVLNSPCMTDALEAKMACLRRAAEYNGKTETDGMIRELMNAAAIKYPSLGLSYGYIGNCSLFDNAKSYDDRSFMVFTKLRDKGGYSVTFGGHSSVRLGALLVEVENGLDAWCAKQVERLDTREIYRVGQPLAA